MGRLVLVVAIVVALFAATIGSTLVTNAPAARQVKIEVCVAAGQSYEACEASVPLTLWDHLHRATTP